MVLLHGQIFVIIKEEKRIHHKGTKERKRKRTKKKTEGLRDSLKVLR
jgi:hypothetical protein